MKKILLLLSSFILIAGCEEHKTISTEDTSIKIVAVLVHDTTNYKKNNPSDRRAINEKVTQYKIEAINLTPKHPNSPRKTSLIVPANCVETNHITVGNQYIVKESLKEKQESKERYRSISDFDVKNIICK